MAIVAVPAGQLATIVTSLEMLAPPAAPSGPQKSALRLDHWPAPVDRDRYRALFRAIGAPWLWRGRLVMADQALAAVLDAPTTTVHVAARRDGTPVGLLELDFSVPATCEIAYFGLVPGMTGNGHGAWLMAHALRMAWKGQADRPVIQADRPVIQADRPAIQADRPVITRVWVHTCDLDHPSALGFYQRQGFVPFERGVEIYPDPRAAGLYPRDAAPRVPLL